MDLQTRGEEEADRVGDQLFVDVGILPYQCFLGAFLDAAEKNFGGIGGRCWASEDIVVGFKGCRGGLSVYPAELIENTNHSHSRMPSPNVWIVRYFEGSVDACVKGRKTRAFDILH